MRSSAPDIQTADGVADAYLTRPDDDAAYPGVLLLIDAFGLRPRIREMADHIAAQGYVVLAPNLFYRSGRAPVLPFPDMTDPSERDEFMGKLGPIARLITPEGIAADGAAYLDELATVSDGPFGLTGYCMGGRFAWSIAAAEPERVAALAGFHTGRLVADGPDSPHLLATAIQAEVYYGHADHDGSMTPDDQAAIERVLTEANVTHRTEVYAGAPHGYTMSDTPAYDEAATQRAFTELFALLDRTLG